VKITEIRTHKLSIPHRGNYHWNFGAPAGTNNVLVEVHTDAGIVGYGDALGSRSAVAAAAAVHSVEHILSGEDPFRIEYLLGQMYHRGNWHNQRRFANQAFAGIEMALWDICGKALDQPVHNLLGGKIHEEIHWFGFLQGGGPDELAADARRYVERGFELLYLKVGMGAQRDLAAVRAVREAVGEEPRLRIDPNEAWDRYTALHMIRKLTPYGLDWVEQPLVFTDLAGAAMLRQQVEVPLALDQALFTEADVLEAIRRDACDVIVLGFHETGGLLSLKKAAAIAAAGGLMLNRHGALGESGISTLAALQVLTTIPNLTDGNQVMHELFVEDVLVEGLLNIEGGRTRVPDRPGLGIEINWDNVERFERLFEENGQYSM
jgi:L-alanine-DL-glutamate epimerase-like enolase superfamily enzyme